MTFERVGRVLAMVIISLTFSSAAWSASMSVTPSGKGRAAPQAEGHAGSVGQYEAFYVLSCLVALETADFGQAEADCGKAIDLNSKDGDAYKLRGYAYLLEHRFERAEDDFREALLITPGDAEIRAGYAQSLSGQGQFAQAVVEFGKAIALAPQNAGYWNARCWARSGTGTRLDRALADCNHALSLAPGSAGVLNSRGMVRLRMNQFPAAILDYTASLKIKPSQASAVFGRGVARLRLGEEQSGAADILLARQMDPEIDDLFVAVGVLPRDCARGLDRKGCLPALRPLKHPGPTGPWAMINHDPSKW